MVKLINQVPRVRTWMQPSGVYVSTQLHTWLSSSPAWSLNLSNRLSLNMSILITLTRIQHPCQASLLSMPTHPPLGLTSCSKASWRPSSVLQTPILLCPTTQPEGQISEIKEEKRNFTNIFL